MLRDTHASTTDPEAHLYRKSRQDAFRLSYLGHVLMENRSGLPVGACVTPASPQGEWEASVALAQNQGKRRITLGADKGYDEVGLLAQLRQLRVTPHIQKQENETRRSHMDAYPAASRLSNQHHEKEVDRTYFRLVEDHSAGAQGAPPRACTGGVDVRPGGKRLPLGAAGAIGG